MILFKEDDALEKFQMVIGVNTWKIFEIHIGGGKMKLDVEKKHCYSYMQIFRIFIKFI